MHRTYVAELGDSDHVNEVFQAFGKQLRPNRNGDLYLQVELADRSGSISARMWNAGQSVYRGFENGDFVRIEGTAQMFQGAMQLIATNIDKVKPGEINQEDFMPQSPVDREKLANRLAEILRTVADPHLRNLVDCFLMDEKFMQKFTTAPAGIKNHHAYLGGLVEHVVQLLEVIDRIADLYPQINRDLWLLGAFLHDMGKINELSQDCTLAYTDEGQMIGHVVIAVSLLEEKLREAQKLSGETMPPAYVLRLKHMIISHHGEYEFGAPKLPMTLEAIALSQLDDLDAKIHSFRQQMEDDPNTESIWTVYNPQIRRKLYKSIEEPAKDGASR